MDKNAKSPDEQCLFKGNDASADRGANQAAHVRGRHVGAALAGPPVPSFSESEVAPPAGWRPFCYSRGAGGDCAYPVPGDICGNCSYRSNCGHFGRPNENPQHHTKPNHTADGYPLIYPDFDNHPQPNPDFHADDHPHINLNTDADGHPFAVVYLHTDVYRHADFYTYKLTDRHGHVIAYLIIDTRQYEARHNGFVIRQHNNDTAGFAQINLKSGDSDR